ncbi:MAG: 2-amino-4-hydroxy-6-hydroxymethyldihydropteridine diphosphokinase [FCB group bacterium]|nr:2-amino-4-hydroxy-6-hydroxymethyldihydropteridine diphosphokinase [FCB group bacterium]
MIDSGEPETLVYIGIGSNIEPERNIPRALELLAEKVDLRAVSPFYRSAAVGPPGQPDFLNGVCRIATTLGARALKNDVLRAVEAALGRVRGADKYAPRTIDLDILLYGAEVYDEEDLRIPDPDIRTRPFVAVPLLAVAPGAVLADTGECVIDLPVAHREEGLEVDMGFSEKLLERFQNERQAR